MSASIIGTEVISDSTREWTQVKGGLRKNKSKYQLFGSFEDDLLAGRNL